MKTLELNSDYQNDYDGKYGFEFDHTFVTNPIVSYCMRFNASPIEYGFNVLDTGWDCIGHSQYFILNGKRVLMLINDINHLINDKTIYANVTICDPELMDNDLESSIIDQYTISR
jgi:hypothetical protein